jgi:hypothetical protein
MDIYGYNIANLAFIFIYLYTTLVYCDPSINHVPIVSLNKRQTEGKHNRIENDKLTKEVETVNKTSSVQPSLVSYSIMPTPTYSTVLNQTLNGTALQYTNTSDPLVQYDLECKADELFCNKVSKSVGAAIDEFTRVVNVKNSLL